MPVAGSTAGDTAAVPPPISRRAVYDGEAAPPQRNRVFPGRQVRYLDAAQRAAYRLSVGADGLLRTADGALFDTSDARTLHKPAEPRAIFVLAVDGVLYASERHIAGEFQHSSFMAGGDVLMAGELEVRSGLVVLVSNRSDHYRPSPEHAAAAAAYLVHTLGVRPAETCTLETVRRPDE